MTHPTPWHYFPPDDAPRVAPNDTWGNVIFGFLAAVAVMTGVAVCLTLALIAMGVLWPV